MLYLADEGATRGAGEALAGALSRLRIVPAQGLHLHLCGPLGAGKTTLVRGMLRALGVQGPVKSPTYTLVEPYRAASLQIYHFDLYRVGDAEELELLGARDYFHAGAVCVFEWPERGAGWLPGASLVLELRVKGSGRELRVQPLDAAGEVLQRALQQARVLSDDIKYLQ
jgi:tRNA threonylcarbamoyladenosine biosynthesis protein TsaE